MKFDPCLHYAPGDRQGPSIKEGAPFRSLSEGSWGWKNPQHSKATRRINWRLIALLGLIDVFLAAAFATYSFGGGGASGGSFVDCASIGKVTSTSDPPGDVFYYRLGAPPADQPQLDLTEVSVARGGDKLCVDFTTTARPQRGATLGVWLAAKTPDGVIPPGGFAGEDIRLVFDPSGQRYVTVRPTANPDLDYGFREAEVGQAGNRTSIVIGRDELPSSTPFEDFMWHAETISAQSQPEQYHDIAPGGETTIAAALRYPEGTLWVEPPPQVQPPAPPPAAVQPPAPQQPPPVTPLPTQPQQSQVPANPSSAPSFTSADVEREIALQLPSYGLEGWTVTCQPGVIINEGDSLSCSISSEGATIGITITLKHGSLAFP